MTEADSNGATRVRAALPTRDETAGLTIGGAFGIILVWWLQEMGCTIPMPVAAAIGTVTAQVTHYLSSFLPRRPA